ncbi:hypothetical protein V1525DRAFT_385215 [Lipomyces kononenkoae]|uniref:Uncharacterized protein n=1 Tax=Lipomyces kononenkoae TaxID=34357 RepID=A0ACC3TB42_LIPKO
MAVDDTSMQNSMLHKLTQIPLDRVQRGYGGQGDRSERDYFYSKPSSESEQYLELFKSMQSISDIEDGMRYGRDSALSTARKGRYTALQTANQTIWSRERDKPSSQNVTSRRPWSKTIKQTSDSL